MDAYHNPFAAIRDLAEAHGVLDKFESCLAGVTKWPYVDHETFFDDLLQEIYGATGIRIRFDRSNADYLFRAEKVEQHDPMGCHNL